MYITLAQIAGGLFGVSIAYVWYRIDENYHDRILAKHQAKHQAEMELLRQQKLKIKS